MNVNIFTARSCTYYGYFELYRLNSKPEDGAVTASHGLFYWLALDITGILYAVKWMVQNIVYSLFLGSLQKLQ